MKKWGCCTCFCFFLHLIISWAVCRMTRTAHQNSIPSNWRKWKENISAILFGASNKSNINWYKINDGWKRSIIMLLNLPLVWNWNVNYGGIKLLSFLFAACVRDSLIFGRCLQPQAAQWRGACPSVSVFGRGRSFRRIPHGLHEGVPSPCEMTNHTSAGGRELLASKGPGGGVWVLGISHEGGAVPESKGWFSELVDL